MIPLITLAMAAADPGDLMAAAEAEMNRAMTLQLPEQPSPYLINYEILDGSVATSLASFGGIISESVRTHRNIRAEVRVGDYAFDNTNFNPMFGERNGTSSRGLPHEDNLVALQREIWLATDIAYKGATEQLSAKIAAWENRPPSEIPDLIQVSPLITDPLEKPTLQENQVSDLVRQLTMTLHSHEHLEDADAIARDWQGVRMLCSTEGNRAWIPTGFSVVRVEAISRAEDGARLRNARWWVAPTMSALPSVDSMNAELEEMADWLAQSITAPVEEDYLGPVLFEDDAAVELFRQLLLPELSGTPPAAEPPDGFEGTPTVHATARLGRRLLPAGWQVVDDPSFNSELAGSYQYDFEGVAPRSVELVEDGVVRDLLMSRIPSETSQQSTGHGRALGMDRREAIPGVVTVAPRRQRSDKRLRRKALALAREAGLPYILVIRRLEPPAMAEDFRIAFSGEGPLPGLTRPLEAYRLYPDGREEPVRGLEFVGVDRRVLRDIAMAGGISEPTNAMDSAPGSRRFSIGAVGGLPVTWSAPSVVIVEMELRGQGGIDQRVLPPPPR